MIKEQTKARIEAAADALAADGVEHPTNAQIIKKLGGGSLSTISPVMREWRERRKENQETLLEIPPALQQSIAEVVESGLAKVWATASNMAGSSIDAIKRESEIEISALESERTELLEALEVAEKALEDAKAETKRAQENAKAHKARNAEQALEIRTLESTNQLLESHLKDSNLTIKELKPANKELQAELIDIARGRD